MVNLLEIGELLPNGTYKLKDGLRDYKRIRQTALQKNFLANNGYQSVNSSVISAVAQDDKALYIRFHNGSIYAYRQAQDKYDDILGANSKGKYFNKYIKRKYSFAKLQSLPFPQELQTAETQALSVFEDGQIFDLLDNQEFSDLIRNIPNPQINFNVVFENGNELLQILINGVAIYYLMDTLLKEAQTTRELYFEQLGISI